jgi:hypothetical protein
VVAPADGDNNDHHYADCDDSNAVDDDGGEQRGWGSL